MATFRAIEAVCEGVVWLLENSVRSGDFDGGDVQFQVLRLRDLGAAPTDAGTTRITQGVSLFLYRVTVNGTQRPPPGRGPERTKTRLPLDLHVLMTAWAQDVSMQHQILGWMMRTLEDTPILPPNVLNVRAPGTFGDDEIVELFANGLDTENLLHMWEIAGSNRFEISVPYVIRGIRIDTREPEQVSGAPTQDRQLVYGGYS